MIKCAANWKQLGKNLNINEDLLNIIDNDYPHCEDCCSKMLSDWLDFTPHASWETLLNAVDKTKNTSYRVPGTVEKLDTAEEKLPVTVEKLSTTTDKLDYAAVKIDYATDKLPNTVGKSADKLPKAVDRLCEAIDKLPKVVGKVHITENTDLDDFTGSYLLLIMVAMYIYIL